MTVSLNFCMYSHMPMCCNYITPDGKLYRQTAKDMLKKSKVVPRNVKYCTVRNARVTNKNANINSSRF